MKRLFAIAVSTLALSAAGQALAADYAMYPELRPAYPDEWASSEDNPLRFEAGLRYWYSWGGQDIAFGANRLSSRDQTHLVEVHTKIEDLTTQSYVRAHGGFGVATTGTYDFTPSAGTGLRIGGSSYIGHAGFDFGWMPFGSQQDGFTFGGLAGYQYWKDSPDLGRGNFATAIGASGTPTAGNSATHNLDVHALRLGVTGKAEFSEMFDLTAEIAGVPYAHITGTLGPHEISGVGIGGGTTVYKSSPTSLAGRGYGVMGEMMAGIHPTENLTLRFGGRAWYLQGTLDAQYNTFTVTDADGNPATAPVIGQQAFIQQTDWASLFRYGALFELTGRF